MNNMNFIQTGFKGKNDWWMYVVMFFIVLIGTVIGQIPVTIAAMFKVDGDMGRFVESANKNFADLGIDSNWYLFLLLLSFVVPFIFFYAAVRGMHKKKIAWIITSRNTIDWSRIRFGVLFWGIITIIMLSGAMLLEPDVYVWNFKPIPFLILVLVALVFIPIQTTLEELLFRGYYFQGLGMLFKNNFIPLIVMGCVFGLLHGANPEIEKLGYTALIFYIGTGIFYGIVTLMDDGAELAIGMHAINNVLAALFITTDWTVFQTEALFVDTSEPSLTWEMYVPVFVIYPLMLIVFARKYKWSNWKEKIFGTVEKPVLEEA